MKPLVIFLFIFWAVSLFGEQLLILAGNTNQIRYENVSRLALQAAGGNKVEVELVAGRGNWSWAPRGKIFPASRSRFSSTIMDRARIGQTIR
jgi:hypothetical protein